MEDNISEILASKAFFVTLGGVIACILAVVLFVL